MFHWKVKKLPRIVVNFGPFLCYYLLTLVWDILPITKESLTL